MKIIDFDKLFEQYVSNFLNANKGKYTVEEIEDIYPKLYEKFSQIKIKNIGGKTPNEYYKDNKNNLLQILQAHVRNDISVNSFLQEAISSYVDESVLLDNLNVNFDSNYLIEIINVLNLKGIKTGFNRLIDILLSKNSEEDLVNLVVDILCDNADAVKNELCKLNVENDKMVCVGEILSCVNEKDDNVFNKLKDLLLIDSEHTIEYCSFFIKYNDERILPYLYEIIDSETINYTTFKELKIAIEWLGGNYDKERDFSFDPTYKLLKGE